MSLPLCVRSSPYHHPIPLARILFLHQLTAPLTRLSTMGSHAFTRSAPHLCNRLPPDTHNIRSLPPHSKPIYLYQLTLFNCIFIFYTVVFFTWRVFLLLSSSFLLTLFHLCKVCLNVYKGVHKLNVVLCVMEKDWQLLSGAVRLLKPHQTFCFKISKPMEKITHLMFIYDHYFDIIYCSVWSCNPSH